LFGKAKRKKGKREKEGVNGRFEWVEEGLMMLDGRCLMAGFVRSYAAHKTLPNVEGFV
jgi:hypothetical protein